MQLAQSLTPTRSTIVVLFVSCTAVCVNHLLEWGVSSTGILFSFVWARLRRWVGVRGSFFCGAAIARVGRGSSFRLADLLACLLACCLSARLPIRPSASDWLIDWLHVYERFWVANCDCDDCVIAEGFDWPILWPSKCFDWLVRIGSDRLITRLRGVLVGWLRSVLTSW